MAMKQTLAILILFSCLTAVAQMPPPFTWRPAGIFPEIAPKPARTNITVTWDHPNLGADWLRFNLYTSTNLNTPICQWPKTPMATNTITVPLTERQWFCTVTALNIETGVESEYATKDKP